MLNISQPHAHVVAEFVLDGEKYEVEDFRIDFMQSTDFKGQPQQEVRGGQISIVLPQAANETLYNWAKKATLLKDGKVVFQTDMGMTVLAIEFTNAYCVNLSRNMNASSGTSTSLTIAPENVSLNGIEHTNKWDNSK